ncbi:MAG: RNA polymerase factor sigma-54, partial [Gammaproteobacteria bacterium]|nr:RNA polymerase factor sigma-54 [Gammaproteobacteria bacterium]
NNPERQESTTDAIDNDMDFQSDDSMPDDLQVDSSWDDVYDSALPLTNQAISDNREYEFQGETTESLQDHLLWQAEMTQFSPTDMAIAMTIIDSINEDGYLEIPIEEIYNGLDPDEDVEMDEVVAVLHRIQQFDPVGVGAHNLIECLSIQLNQFDPNTPHLAKTKQIVNEYMELLGTRDFQQLKRKLKVSDDELSEIVNIIQSLNPKPGSQIQTTPPEYIIPDVYVKKHKGQWKVELNTEGTPRIRINQEYVNLIKRANNSNENNILKNHLQEARWFLKSLQSRNETLLKVTNCIVDRQEGFLEHGEVSMRPLVLSDVAKAVDMHESTISRVTTRKYMHTPRGIFELKYFFSSHVGTSAGGECSSTAIRAIIKELVEAENSMKPLSDSKIANILSEQGIKVARRTVAKYREALAIPPSNERKRHA